MFCYSNNGLSMRSVDPDYVAQSGEVLFEGYATSDQLGTAFPGYAADKALADQFPAAQALLTKTDTVVKRINEGISLGLTTATTADVVAYMTFIRALRAWIASPTGTAPVEPPYPSGT
jgi:hypothetical protein